MTDTDLHLDTAVQVFYGLERQPGWPAFQSEEADDIKRDIRYRLMGAIRRGIASCRAVAIERVASTLANLDGEIWPACDAITSPNWKPEQRAAIVAQRRQLYRHKAVQIIAALYGYMEVEHPSETEEHRQLLIRQAVEQREADVKAVTEWRDSIGMPSQVESQIPQSVRGTMGESILRHDILRKELNEKGEVPK